MTTIIKYRLRCLLRNRVLLFWTLFFPLALATLLGLTVRNIISLERFKQIPIAIINSETMQQDSAFHQVIKEVSTGEDALFQVVYISEDEAINQLEDNTLEAYIVYEDGIQVKVDANGLNQTIVQTFMNEYVQQKHMIENLIAQGVTPQQLQDNFQTTQNYIEENGNANADISVVYFFSLLAMTSLFGAYWSLRSLDTQLANHSPLGARIAMSPTSRAISLAIDFILTLSIQYTVQLIITAYLIFALNIPFGDHVGYVLLAMLFGTFSGNGLGTVIAAYSNKDFDANIGKVTAVTMLCSAMAGLMIANIRFYIAIYAPILNAINPAALISDSFYTLFYYGVNERFFMNLALLAIFTLLCYGLAYIRLRRKQYASL